MTGGSWPGSFIEMDEQSFLAEAVRLVDVARARGIVLRILGAVGVYAHSLDSNAAGLFGAVGRFEGRKQIFTDLDLAGYSGQRKEITNFFREMKFQPAGMVNALFGSRRMIFYHPTLGFQTDVFFDRLEFSHDVQFGERPGEGRLELDYPTVTLADLVLEKLQIHTINRKDLVDLVVLFAGHEIRSGERDSVDGKYISSVLSDDWGFWYDAVANLNKVRDFAGGMAARNILPETLSLASERVGQLLSLIEAAPKSAEWQKRARKGTAKKWYREVEEVSR